MTPTPPTNQDYSRLLQEKQADFARLNIAENPDVVRQKVADILGLLTDYHAVIQRPMSEWDTDPVKEVQVLLDKAFAGNMVRIEPFQKLKDWVAKWVV